MYSKKGVKKVLITGGAGYLGNKLIQSLPENVDIVVIDNFCINTRFKEIENEKLQKDNKLTLIKSNVSEINKYKNCIENLDVLVYMASLNSFKESNNNPLLYLRENNINLQIFLGALKQQSPDIKKIILTSTRGVYGEGPYACNKCHNRIYPSPSETLKCTECQSSNISPQKIVETDTANPSSYYGISKKLQEEIIKLYCSENRISLDIFRIFNVYGENQGEYYTNIGIIPQIYEQIINKKEVYLNGNGSVTRDFVYVGDVVKMLSDSIFGKNKRINQSEIYNLASGQPISILDITYFFENLGYKFKKNNLRIINDIKYSVADNSKIMKTFEIDELLGLFSFLGNYYKKTNVE